MYYSLFTACVLCICLCMCQCSNCMCPAFHFKLLAWSIQWRCHWLVWGRGGQVMTLNQVLLSVFFEEMRGIFDMSSNCCMLCGHGSKKSPASSHCPASIALLGICHLTVAMAKINTQLVLEYIAAMGDDAFVMRQLDRIRQPSSVDKEVMSSKSSLFEFDRCANLICCNFTRQVYCHFQLNDLKSSVTNDYCWSCLGQCFMPVRCLCSWVLSVNIQRGPWIAVIAQTQIPLPFLQSLQNEF